MITTQKYKVPTLRFPEFSGEWKEKQIGNTLTIGSGRDYKHLNAGEVPVFGTGGHMTFVDDFLYDGESVCIGRKGTIDQPRYINGKFWTVDTLFYTHSFKSLEPKFIYAVFQRVNWKKYNEASGVPSLSKKTIEKIKVGIPSSPEQRKIASFLSSVDTRIEQLRKKVSLLKQYKKGIMQKLFNQDIFFKDEQGDEYPDWEEKKTSDVFQVTRGNVLAVSKMTPTPFEESIYPVYSSQTKENGLTGYFPEYLYEDSITWTTDGANAGDVKYREGKFYCTNVCGVLISEKGFANSCVAEMLNKVTERYVSYVGNPKLMNNVMAQIKIRFPSIPEQQKIANFLSAIDKKIELVGTELELAKTFKKGLLQQMFI